MFERLGYGAATIADITAEAGVSRATFYVYFASKQDVFVVLAEQVRDRYLHAQELGDLDESDVGGVLHQTIAATLDVTIEHLTLMTVLDHQALADPQIKRLWGEIRGRSVRRTARFVERAARRGLARPVAEPETLALMGLGLNEMFAPRVADGEISRDHAVREIAAVWMVAVGSPS